MSHKNFIAAKRRKKKPHNK